MSCLGFGFGDGFVADHQEERFRSAGTLESEFAHAWDKIARNRESFPRLAHGQVWMWDIGVNTAIWTEGKQGEMLWSFEVDVQLSGRVMRKWQQATSAKAVGSSRRLHT